MRRRKHPRSPCPGHECTATSPSRSARGLELLVVNRFPPPRHGSPAMPQTKAQRRQQGPSSSHASPFGNKAHGHVFSNNRVARTEALYRPNEKVYVPVKHWSGIGSPLTSQVANDISRSRDTRATLTDTD